MTPPVPRAKCGHRAHDCADATSSPRLPQEGRDATKRRIDLVKKRTVEDAAIRRALRIIQSRVRNRSVVLTSPESVRDYLRLRIAAKECEVFLVLFLDAQHRLIAAEEMFRGTLTQTSVYPREVVKAALGHNAAAVILAHNHPSGVAEPSRADELLTASLKQALSLVDCRTLDHIVVGGSTTTSFAERGLI